MSKPKIPNDKSGIIFGDRVKALRIERTNLSQEGFGKKAGFHRTFIGRVERGETNITLVNILRICNVLQVTISEFFEGFEEALENHDQSINDNP